MRTADEIADHYERSRGADVLGFTAEAMLTFLPFEIAKRFLDPQVTTDQWKNTPLTRDDVLETMREYMRFAWDKALDHRGISASRSVEKMAAWLWILGDDEAVRFAKDDDNYPQYGAPVLAYICERYGFEIPDNPALARMARGKRCDPDGCDDGCGR